MPIKHAILAGSIAAMASLTARTVALRGWLVISAISPKYCPCESRATVLASAPCPTTTSMASAFRKSSGLKP